MLAGRALYKFATESWNVLLTRGSAEVVRYLIVRCSPLVTLDSLRCCCFVTKGHVIISCSALRCFWCGKRVFTISFTPSALNSSNIN